jgi:penicillin amidase
VPSAQYLHDRAYLESKVPPPEARVDTAVGAPVRVDWDRWGVPHIRATVRTDLFLALGYVTAQDCLWRLDYCRRQARGELSEVLGPETLPSDRLVRTIGLGRHADDLAAGALPPVERAVFEAYAVGINRWLERAVEQRRLPVEFDWLGYEPRPWTVADSIAVWKYRWWGLTGRLDNVVLAEAARRHLPDTLLAPFLATELGEETILPRDSSVASVPGGSDRGEGSNNWVVAGSRTTTGSPVLCCDPHNPFSQPGQWFDAYLTLEDGSLDVAGATYAGFPGVYIGRNRHVAWGFTNHVAPVRDLYVESGDAEVVVERESIPVRGEAPQTLEIRRTRRGPIVTAFLPDVGGPGEDVSLRWAGVEVSTGLTAMVGLNAAQTAAEAVEALRDWPCPPLNAMVADDGGHIVYHVVGLVPRRPVSRRGFRRADRPEDAWDGFIPYERLPHLVDPAQGWLASANQPPWRLDPPDLPYVAGGAWADGGRMRRIRERLTERDKLSPQEIGAVQADITSVRARELLAAVRGFLSDHAPGLTGQALQALAVWDCQYTVDAVGPAVWTAFWEAWLERVVAARLPQGVAALASSQAGAVARRLLLGDDTSPPWFQDGSVASHARAAFDSAVERLTRRLGSDVAAWEWGSVHTVTYQHALSSVGPPNRRQAARQAFDVGPFPTSGGPTVRAAGHAPARPFAVTGGATYRLIADLSSAGGIVVTATTGQSGHPGSPHYADQVSFWLEDRYRPIAFDGLEPERTTHLVPAGWED